MPSKAQRSTRGKCTFDGCGRPRSSQGLCGPHAIQATKGRPLRPIRAYRRRGCSHDGCDEPHHAHGLCSTHCRQAVRDGAVIDVVDRSGPSEVVLFGDHAEIILTDTRGRERARAVIDLADVGEVSGHRWAASRAGHTTYAKGYPAGRRGDGLVYLHRRLVAPGRSLVIDHINGDGLDNRRANLQAVTRRLNAHNQIKQPRNKSGHRGVHWDKLRGGWCAQVLDHGRRVALGRFDDLEEAARVAREARERLYENFQTRTQ